MNEMKPFLHLGVVWVHRPAYYLLSDEFQVSPWLLSTPFCCAHMAPNQT